MRINLLILFFTVFIVKSSFAQLRVVDSLSKVAIPAVSVFASDGRLLGITDKDGLLELDTLSILPSTKLIFQHIAYSTKEINWSDVAVEDVVNLSVGVIVIPTIAVSGEQKDWLVLRGYFRSLGSFDGGYRFFSDCIIYYYIPLKAKNVKSKFRIEDQRFYGNTEKMALFKEVMGPFVEPPMIMNIQAKALHERLSKEYEIQKDGEKYNFLKKGQKVGEMKSLPGGMVQSYIDYLGPDTVQHKKILRLEGFIKQLAYIETYEGERIENVHLSQLKGIYKSTVASIKRKKRFGFIPYGYLSEFYVMDRAFLRDDELELLKGSFTKSMYLKEESSYKSDFWKDLDKYGIPALPEGVEKKIGKELKLF